MVRKYNKRSKSRPRRKRASPKARIRSRSRARAPRRSPAKGRISKVHSVERPMSSTAAQSLAIYANPFSLSSGQPKIPDGKAVMSIGAKLQVSAQLNNTQAGDDILHVLLYPGLTQGMVVWGDTAQLGTRGFTAYGYNNHTTYDLSGVASGSNGNIDANDNINEWRIVSQGLKLSLLNTDEENDGWFECIRYKDSFKASENAFYSGDNLQQTTAAVYGPDIQFGQSLANKNLVNSPTYVSGTLNDIHKYQFSLQAQTEDHNFMRLPERWYMENGIDNGVIGGINEYVNLQADTAQCHSIQKSLVDQAYDAVYIRIHCRANTGTSSNTGSKLLAHLISNQELVYDEDQNEHKFMTQTQFAQKAVNKANERQRKNNTGAALGTATGSRKRSSPFY